MPIPRYKSLVVKIGSNVIAQEDGSLSEEALGRLIAQIAELVKQGIRIVVVTSGAVASGRRLFRLRHDVDAVVRRQVFAAIGQVALMHTYARLFAPHNLVSAQVLATKEDFRDRQHYINMRNCIAALLGEGLIPLINENDVVAISELMFTDNDELAGLVASMLNFDALALLTSVDGILDRPPPDPEAKVIPVIETEKLNWRMFLQQLQHGGRSSMGRGGMRSKCELARRMAAMGIATYIANGRRTDTLTNIIYGDHSGTFFPPNRRASNTKRRIAHTAKKDNAQVLLNSGACDAIRSQKHATSLLPIGIIAIKGEFQRGDIVSICNQDGCEIGVGIAQYDSVRAREWLGQRGHRPLIHYNSLSLHP